MDMRDKLFPIFLKESARNLKVLQTYLKVAREAMVEPEELESAFRAAHTLKGTARLVQVDSVHQVGRRLERLLEKHFTNQTRPTAVEYEAIELAIAWLQQLLLLLKEDQPIPKSLVDEASKALDLVERYPGDTPLVELLDSELQHRSPKLKDPFDCDPELKVDEDDLLRHAQDPFADDPDFGMEMELVNGLVDGPKAQSVPVGSAVVEVDSEDCNLADVSDTGLKLPVEMPFDPFADDGGFEGVDLEMAATAEDLSAISLSESTEDVASAPTEGELPLEGAAESDAASESYENLDRPQPAVADTLLDSPLPLASGVDPFAEDDLYDAELPGPATVGEELQSLSSETVFADEPQPETAEDRSFLAAAGEPTDRAQKILDSLLIPDEQVEARRDYLCCSFSLAGRAYYLPIEHMLEIADLDQLLPLPMAPKIVAGLVNLRGEVLPVIDLSTLQRGAEKTHSEKRLVVAAYQQEKIAFLADGIPYLAEELVGEKVDLPKFLAHYKIKGVET